MDKLKRQYITEKKIELKQQTHYKKTAEEVLLDASVSEFIRKNAEKKLNRANEKIHILKELLNSKDLDDRISQELSKLKLKSAGLKRDEKNKQIDKLSEKRRKKEIRQNYYGTLRSCSKLIRETRYQIRRSERWLAKKEKYFPQAKKRKLENMPNNKGYIWHGIYYYGAKPANPGEPIILFEQKGSVLYIHEITKKYHKVYEKKTKTAARKLIENRQRNCNFIKNNSLVNFLK